WMTPLELMEYLGKLFRLDTKARRQRSQELLEHVGLTDVRSRRIGGFSRGMRQRLGLAQAMINQPEVLFLDEPVSALDPQGRKDVLEIIAGLHGRCTVFMSTHILGDVERVCDSVGIINQGQLVVEANRQELVERYSPPAFEIEVEHNGHDTLDRFAAMVEKQTYVTGVTRAADTLRVLVSDIPTSRTALLSLIDREKLPIRRFEVVTPTLEDIFLKLTNKEGASS
ncbi:MAG TPA: ABC transporter ATP-binding protein, partial [Longilinea sp.]|nr:ABC transporter ATP-binding protein [Longilinea sp.]